MRLSHIIGALIAFAIGYLVWRGSGSIVKAIAGGLLIPLIAVIVLGITLGPEALKNAGGPLLVVLVLGMIAFLAFVNRRP